MSLGALLKAHGDQKWEYWLGEFLFIGGTFLMGAVAKDHTTPDAPDWKSNASGQSK